MTIVVITRTGEAPSHAHRYVPAMKVKATVAGSVDVAAVEAHIERYFVSCPLCKAVGALGVAQHVCGIEACDGADDSIHAIMIVCKRCGYLIPVSAEHIAGVAEQVA